MFSSALFFFHFIVPFFFWPQGRGGDNSYWPSDTTLIDRSSINGNTHAHCFTVPLKESKTTVTPGFIIAYIPPALLLAECMRVWVCACVPAVSSAYHNDKLVFVKYLAESSLKWLQWLTVSRQTAFNRSISCLKNE